MPPGVKACWSGPGQVVVEQAHQRTLNCNHPGTTGCMQKLALSGQLVEVNEHTTHEMGKPWGPPTCRKHSVHTRLPQQREVLSTG
jgi:hypothetical protein